jgi:hypothetical protein
VRLDIQVGQDPADLGGGDPHVRQFLGQLRVAPVAGRVRRFLGHRGHDPQPLVVAVDQGAARPLAVLQAGQAYGRKPPPPVRDGVLVHAHHRGDLAVGHAIGGQQHHPSSLGGPLRRGVGADPAAQLGAFLIGDHQRRDGRHAAAPRRGDEQPSYANN